jgi:hypothetical protein
VSCQTQILQRYCFESEIRKALMELPSTLDETYQRILANIPVELTQYVQRCLVFLLFSSPAPTNVLISFMGETQNDQTSPSTVVATEAMVVETLGCLISVQQHRVKLAHYTIKEYLQSPRLAESSVRYFYLPEELTRSYFLRILFRTVLRTTEQEGHFARYCAQRWDGHLQKEDTPIASDHELSTLTFNLLHPKTTNHLCSSGAHIFEEQRLSFLRKYVSVESNGFITRNPDAEILFRLIRLKLYATTTTFLLQHSPEAIAMLSIAKSSSWDNIPLIGWLVRKYETPYVMLLLERSAELPLPPASLYLMAMEMPTSDHGIIEEMIRTLISAEVSLDATGVRITPLQVAVQRLARSLVRVLLQHGADPNAIDDPDGWAPWILNYHFASGQSPLRLVRGLIESHVRAGTSAVRTVDISGISIERLLIAAGGRDFSRTSPEESPGKDKPAITLNFSFA